MYADLHPVAPAYVFGRSAKLGTYSLIIKPARSFALRISICEKKVKRVHKDIGATD
jgi:hypothetical protein